MLIPYSKRYIRFIRVEENERTLIYAALFENNGQQEVALCEPRLVRVFMKAVHTTLTLPSVTTCCSYGTQSIVSPFVETFFSSSKIPTCSYARPPTK